MTQVNFVLPPGAWKSATLGEAVHKAFVEVGQSLFGVNLCSVALLAVVLHRVLQGLPLD